MSEMVKELIVVYGLDVFFFQAEDGIRDVAVTGVQTCALPIYLGMSGLVHLSSLEDDFYLFDSARSHLIGRRSRRVIRLGEKVEVQIAAVNTFKDRKSVV